MANALGTPPHVSDLDLIQFADGEMPAAEVTSTEIHLRTCSKCRARLDRLKTGAGAYDRYHAQLLKPSLKAPGEWPSLAGRLEALEQQRKRFFVPGVMRWAAAMLACCVLGAGWLLYNRQTASRHMQQVLAQAVAARTPPDGRLHVTANGHGWYRAASLQGGMGRHTIADGDGLEETRVLFVRAKYSWDDPLSARSFAMWRRGLPEKRDKVLSIEHGSQRFYRLQTETSASVLRTASLTLRADTLNPVKGAFHFEGQREVSIDEAGEMPEAANELKAKKKTRVERPAVVKEAGPEEELQVFAALDAIGADVGEPVTVALDASKQQIVVTGVGVSANREREIRHALVSIPNTSMRFRSGQPTSGKDRPGNSGGAAFVTGAPLRHALETRAGGAQQFQMITDRALDASSAILAQANALHALAQQFPTPVAAAFSAVNREILSALRRGHATAIEQTAAGLKDALQPLLSSTNSGADETQSQPSTSWEVDASRLVERARQLDDSLGLVLAGSYSQEAGETILGKLPNEIQGVEALARSQENIR